MGLISVLVKGNYPIAEILSENIVSLPFWLEI
ncbi:unnamed protein product, partial [marine sediment metagenome]